MGVAEQVSMHNAQGAVNMDEYVSIEDAVNMVSRKYGTLGHIIHAHKRTEDSDSRLLLELAILVHVYLKIGKPTEMKHRIAAIWDVLCTN